MVSTVSSDKLLIRYTLDHFLSIVKDASQWHTIKCKQESKVSYASLLDVIGEALAQPKSVTYTFTYLMLLLDTVLAKQCV